VANGTHTPLISCFVCLTHTHTHTPHILSLQTCVGAVRTSRRPPASCSSSPWHFGCCRVVVAHRPILHEGSRRRPPSNLTRRPRAIRKNVPCLHPGTLNSGSSQPKTSTWPCVVATTTASSPLRVLARVLPGLEVALSVAQVFDWGWQLKTRVIFSVQVACRRRLPWL
jgi:hypothetical protein